MALSAVIITKNAAGQLGECLASVAFADEILVVDSGSTDATCALARAQGARVVEHPWLGFGAQKQFAVQAAAHDWVLCVDADERVSPALRDAIARELAAPRARVYAVARCNRFLGRWLRHGEGYPDWSVRLFHRGHARWTDDPVHEKVVSDAPATRLAGDLMHDSAETLDKYLDKQNRYTSLQAETLRAAGARATMLHLALAPALRFLKFYLLRLGFLDGAPGLVHIAIGCMNSFNKYAKLMALERAGR
jgi:glycosyltransferase involved in cell wall biosynthesis